MTIEFDLGQMFYMLAGLAATGVGAYIAIRSDLATHAAEIKEAKEEAAEAKATCIRAHTRIDDHVKDWHRGVQ